MTRRRKFLSIARCRGFSVTLRSSSGERHTSSGLKIFIGFPVPGMRPVGPHTLP